MRMRSASTVFDIMACCSGLRAIPGIVRNFIHNTDGFEIKRDGPLGGHLGYGPTNQELSVAIFLKWTKVQRHLRGSDCSFLKKILVAVLTTDYTRIRGGQIAAVSALLGGRRFARRRSQFFE